MISKHEEKLARLFLTFMTFISYLITIMIIVLSITSHWAFSPLVVVSIILNWFASRVTFEVWKEERDDP